MAKLAKTARLALFEFTLDTQKSIWLGITRMDISILTCPNFFLLLKIYRNVNFFLEKLIGQ